MLRSLFLFLARREGFKNFALQFNFFRKTASRFIAGDTLDDAIVAVRRANDQGMLGTLDFLGENTLSREDASRAAGEILDILDRIETEKVRCNVSVKLTQLGLAQDPEFCERQLFKIVERARDCANFIRVDMEDSPYTRKTLDIVLRVHEKFDNVGAVIQSYLYRSEQDTARLLKAGIRIRLVKGAYQEPENVAFPRKRDTDANFLKLMKMLLTSPSCHAIATHDEAILRATMEFARTMGIPKNHFEFQLLYGIRRDLQLELVREGYNVRLYIPYGAQWYPYFMRRLAERPANVAFIVRNFFKD